MTQYYYITRTAFLYILSVQMVSQMPSCVDLLATLLSGENRYHPKGKRVPNCLLIKLPVIYAQSHGTILLPNNDNKQSIRAGALHDDLLIQQALNVILNLLVLTRWKPPAWLGRRCWSCAWQWWCISYPSHAAYICPSNLWKGLLFSSTVPQCSECTPDHGVTCISVVISSDALPLTDARASLGTMVCSLSLVWMN